MSGLLLLPFCLAAGYLLQRQRLFPAESSVVLNTFIIWISFPALILVQVPALLARLEINKELLVPALAAWVAFAIAATAVYAAAKRFKWSRATTGALMLTAGLGNTSFVGFPIIEALHGARGLQYALIVDQLGSFLVLSTVGILIASYYSGNKVSALAVGKGIVTFPPFIAMLIAVALSGSGLLTWLQPVFERLGGTLVPLALVSVGCQLHFKMEVLERRKADLGFGLAVKLLLLPALFAIAFAATGQHSLAYKISVLEVAMGPMITGAIVATGFRLDAEIANLMVGVGTPLSVLTVWLWHLAL